MINLHKEVIENYWKVFDFHDKAEWSQTDGLGWDQYKREQEALEEEYMANEQHYLGV